MENVARVGQKPALDQIQANSSQVDSQTMANLDQVETLARVGLSWDRLARA